MIEVVATLFRWLQLASNMILVGGCVFLAIAGSFHSPWVTRLERALPWLGFFLLIGLLGILATTTAQATGVSDNAWRLQAWFGLIQNTRMGHVWAGRAACAIVVLAIACYLRYSPRARWKYLLCATAASITLTVGALASHSAAEELSVLSILPYALHIILASVWFGALPAFLAVCFACTDPVAIKARDGAKDNVRPGIQTEAIARIHALFQSREQAVHAGARALKRFSTMALPVMLAVIATGVIITDRMVDASYSGLVATRYGWLLDAKVALLAVVLVIAARARSTWLPLLAQGAGPGAATDNANPDNANLNNEKGNLEQALAGGQKLRKWVSFEFMLALGIVLLATIVSNTVPAKHALIQNWPYSFRFSLAATWGDTVVMTRVWSGLALLAVGIIAAVLGRSRRWDKKLRIGVPAVLIIAALGVGLPPLAVDAYPETYRKTPVPFDTISIANGSGLFAENCVACHGPQGKGDGVMAKSFAKPPVDMLTEPHRQAYRRRLLPLAHLRHSRYWHAGICRQAHRRRPLGCGQLPARHVPRLPGAPDEPHGQARAAAAQHGPAQLLLCRIRWLKRHPQRLQGREERTAGAVLLAAVEGADEGAARALSQACPGQHRPAGGAGRRPQPAGTGEHCRAGPLPGGHARRP